MLVWNSLVWVVFRYERCWLQAGNDPPRVNWTEAAVSYPVHKRDQHHDRDGCQECGQKPPEHFSRLHLESSFRASAAVWRGFMADPSSECPDVKRIHWPNPLSFVASSDKK